MNKIALPTSFPNLPSSIKKIQQMFSANDINISSLVKVLQKEPLLCANILKLVNSSYYGLKSRVASIEQAVMLLGVTVIRGIIMATILKKSFPLELSPYSISIEQFDKICILRTNFLKEWLKDENFDLQTLSSVALLMESGKIIIANEILKNKLYSNFIELTNNYSTLEAEKILFDTNGYEIASLLFKQWEFEDTFTKLISNIPNPSTKEQEALHVLSVAINIEGILEEKNLEQATQLLIQYSFDENKFNKTAKLIQKEML